MSVRTREVLCPGEGSEALYRIHLKRDRSGCAQWKACVRGFCLKRPWGNSPGVFAYKSLQVIPSPETLRPPVLPFLQSFLFDFY